MRVVARIWKIKFARFVVVGVFNTMFDLIMLNSLVGIAHLPLLLANTISVSIGITISYFLNRRFVFRVDSANDKVSLAQFLKFFAVTGLSVIVVQNSILYLFDVFVGTRDIGLHGLLGLVGLSHLSNTFINLNTAKIIAVLTGMIWNFLLYNVVVFKGGEMQLEEEVIESE